MRVLATASIAFLFGCSAAVAVDPLEAAQLAEACRIVPPASVRQAPSDVYWVYTVANDRMEYQCGAVPGPAIMGCTILRTATHPPMIFLNADLTPEERDCTLLYEKAHLPPNNWQDPVMEARMR